MKMLIFAQRVSKEILRDPLTLVFGIGFPVALLLLLSAIQANIPVEMFEIEKITPGMTVFGLTFISLFAAVLVAKDRETAFLQRLYTTPLRAVDFIVGYGLPFVPIALAQSVVCYLVALILGLPFGKNIFIALLLIIPVSIFFIFFGILCGSIFSVKQASGICGALFTNLTAWLSGIWFDLNLVGGAFQKVADCLPFIHAVEMEKAALNGNFSAVDDCWVFAYIILIVVLAIICFLKQMKSN
ncbi:MAG: ABC transporter permease [Erysipelotrichia bacterium]|nr:ABC transporter permease [Erysipelotrichia bacterium]